MADDSHLPSPGDVIAGKYRIERLIGRGGMGAVYAAQHTLLNQRVALKLLLGELAASSEATARFMNEARAAARIQGEHVARVLDIGQLPSGAPFMVLEYLEGSDLADLLHKRGTLTVPEVADFALQALDALAQAHTAGIVHRDLKPANLFLTRRHDGTSLVKVLDFGISKNLTPGDGPGHGMTSTRAVIGSPEYMSPEQLRTPREVDTRTDIWSLGVILYELLTGQMPFKGESLPELFVSILETVPPPVRAIRPDIPPPLEAIIQRCMARDRNQRFSNVGELAGALLAFASDQTRAMAAVRSSGGLPMSRSSASSIPMLGTSRPDVISVAGRTGNTAAPWANTGGGGAPAERSNRSRVTAIVGFGVVCMLLSFLLVSVVLKRFLAPSDAAAAAPPEITAAAPPPPAVTATAPVAAALPAATIPGPAAPPPASVAAAVRDAGSYVPPPPRPAVAAAPAAAPPKIITIQPSPPAPKGAPAATKNCTPNYYFDKDGNKHFKPECF